MIYLPFGRSPALFGIVCTFPHFILKRQLICRPASTTKRLLAFFLLVLVPFPNTNKEAWSNLGRWRYQWGHSWSGTHLSAEHFFSFSMHEESTSFCIYPFTLSTQLPPHELCIVFRFQALSPPLLQSASTILLPIIKRIERPHWTSSHSRYRSQNTSHRLTTIFPLSGFPESN